MRTYFTMLGLVILICLAGCKSPAPQESLSPVRITPEQFSGHTFNLVSRKYVEWYQFGDGFVEATYGKKHGMMVAPLFYWHISDALSLVITDGTNGTGSVIRSYQFSSITNSMAVTVDGKRFERQ